jgi:hypothetical protein
LILDIEDQKYPRPIGVRIVDAKDSAVLEINVELGVARMGGDAHGGRRNPQNTAPFYQALHRTVLLY